MTRRCDWTPHARAGRRFDAAIDAATRVACSSTRESRLSRERDARERETATRDRFGNEFARTNERRAMPFACCAARADDDVDRARDDRRSIRASSLARRDRSMSFNAPVEGRSATEAEASTSSRDVDVDVVEEKSDGEGAVDVYGFAVDVAKSTPGRKPSVRVEAFWSRARESGAAETLAEAVARRDPMLKRALRRGVPKDLRRDAWFAASGAGDLQKVGPTDGYYEKLLIMTVDQKVVDQIELDLARTFPANHKYERGQGGRNGNEVLRRILYAYARHNRRTGYCQGMNYIAAFLWLVMGDEEKAFWTFTALLDIILPGDVHAKDIKGTIAQYKILHKLVQTNAPRLAKHFRELEIDLVMIASKWLLCLFVESFPSTTAARVLDCLIYEGEKVWFRVSIAMLKMHEQKILECDTLPDVMIYLKDAFANQTDADELLTFAFENVSLANKTIAAHRAAVMREMRTNRK